MKRLPLPAGPPGPPRTAASESCWISDCKNRPSTGGGGGGADANANRPRPSAEASTLLPSFVVAVVAPGCAAAAAAAVGKVVAVFCWTSRKRRKRKKRRLHFLRRHLSPSARPSS